MFPRHLPIHQPFSPFIHPSILLLCPLLTYVSTNLYLHPFFHPYIHPTYPSHSSTFYLFICPIYIQSFFHLPIYLPTYLSHSHISLISISVLLHHFYIHLSSLHPPITHMLSIQTTFINRPIHRITNLSILLSNPVYFLAQPSIDPSISMHSCT